MTYSQHQYKDRLFTFIFGSPENKAWTLSLFNAVNGSNYDNPDDIEINTIKEILYLTMHNDVSFIIDEQMNLYEQQSSYNPNMPLRLLQYSATLFEQYLQSHKLTRYSSKLLKLPTPKLVVFYNGRKEVEDERLLRLSDSFAKSGDIEVTVRMLNINYGRNSELLAACGPLMEYSWIIHRIMSYNKGNLAEAISGAINDMPQEFALKPFLTVHKSEVLDMLLTEYNESEERELFRQEVLEEGRAEGREEGKEESQRETAKKMMGDGLPVNMISKYTGLSASDIAALRC